MKAAVMKIILAIATLVGGLELSISQGFGNLNFELAVIIPDPSSPYYPYAVFATSAIPGWTAYTYGNQQSDIIFNTLSLGAAAVTLQGPGSLEPIPQENYAMLLQGSSGGPPGSAAISQIGYIRPDTRAVTLFATPGSSLQVTFGSHLIPLVQIGSTANYNILGGDISAYAGTTEELRLTALPNTGAFLDSIQFSTTPVPEPSEIALAVMGALVLGLRRWQMRKR